MLAITWPVRSVFIVTAGDYSDYRILSVWSDREQAEKFTKCYAERTSGGYPDKAEVEEFILDDPRTDGVRTRWVVWFRRSFEGRDLRSQIEGDRVDHLTVEQATEGRVPELGAAIKTIADPRYSLRDHEMIGTGRICVEADDEAHAIRIACDRRAEILAMSGVTAK